MRVAFVLLIAFFTVLFFIFINEPEAYVFAGLAAGLLFNLLLWPQDTR